MDENIESEPLDLHFPIASPPSLHAQPPGQEDIEILLPRVCRVPSQFDNFRLSSGQNLLQLQRPPSPEPQPASLPANDKLLPGPITYIDSESDEWGLHRRYRELPSRFSSETDRPEFRFSSPTFIDVIPADSSQASEGSSTPGASVSDLPFPTNLYHPYSNYGQYALCNWHYEQKGAEKDLDKLVGIIRDPRFSLNQLQDFKASQMLRLLDSNSTPHTSTSESSAPSNSDNVPLPFDPKDGWKESSVKLRLPCPQRKFQSEDKAPEIEIHGIWHRNILSLIQDFIQGPLFYELHLKGFMLMWKPSEDEPAERVHGEAFTSDSVLELEEDVRRSLPEPSDEDENLERVVLPIMIYSDSTHLADFGTASLWPIYAFIVSLSKYIRSLPSVDSALHWAYMPTVCDAFLHTLSYSYEFYSFLMICKMSTSEYLMESHHQLKY
jgi:hypothetical protein